MNTYPFIRKLLFRLDPEQAHQLTIQLIRLAGEVPPVSWYLRQIYRIPTLPVEAFGLKFNNPVGLAAGYDKDGIGWRGLAALGFSHIEIGTVTPRAQPGNPKPRVFRLVDENALINRMGFPGKGTTFVLRQVNKPRNKDLILGINIGKNFDTPLELAEQDYVQLVRAFYEWGDYIAVNISSPNTVGLRRLQEKQNLSALLGRIATERENLVINTHHRVPILVKLAPDLSDEQLDDALDVISINKMDGVIATNTTISRQSVGQIWVNQTGGLSGEPLFPFSLKMVEKIYQRTSGKLPIIGVGGIFNATSVQKMLDAGAVLVQIYTGLIYKGPGLVKEILNEL